MSQYEMTIMYIHRDDNTIVDALLRLPPNCFAYEQEQLTAAVLADKSILDKIKAGYLTDIFSKCVASTSMKGWSSSNRLWYINNRLLIPCIADICEQLFCLTHDSLGHFGADKSYATLCDAYYWPNMW
jgi:Integrase zinc binding domain